MSGANAGSHVGIQVNTSSTHARRLICEQSQNGCLAETADGSLVFDSIQCEDECVAVDSVSDEALREPEVLPVEAGGRSYSWRRAT
eukprot:1443350-Pleurochrysis_carterae.AAC.1